MVKTYALENNYGNPWGPGELDMDKPMAPCRAVVSLRVCDASQLRFTLAALCELRAKTLEEPGCLQFDFFQSQLEPTHLILVEGFRDEAAFKAHLLEPYTQHYFALGLTELLESTPVSNITLDA